MILKRAKVNRVLAVFPSTRGFGYAVFEGPRSPIDWGLKQIRRNKNAQSLEKVRALVEWYEPDVVILEDYAGRGSRRSKRIERLIEAIARWAEERRIGTVSYARSAIRECFATYGAVTKYGIARAIAKELPEFEPRLPPVRKIWMSEDARMSIFDATALVFTYYRFADSRKRAA